VSACPRDNTLSATHCLFFRLALVHVATGVHVGMATMLPQAKNGPASLCLIRLESMRKQANKQQPVAT